jgi:hypothetical protein
MFVVVMMMIIIIVINGLQPEWALASCTLFFPSMSLSFSPPVSPYDSQLLAAK